MPGGVHSGSARLGKREVPVHVGRRAGPSGRYRRRRVLQLGAGLLPSRTYASASLATRVTKAIAERGGDRLVELREQMAVAVEGHVDRGVPHPGLDGLGVGALGDGQRHAGCA